MVKCKQRPAKTHKIGVNGEKQNVGSASSEVEMRAVMKSHYNKNKKFLLTEGNHIEQRIFT